MRRLIIITALSVSCLGAAAGGIDVGPLLSDAPREHPRLFLGRGQTEALRAKIESDPLLLRSFERVTAVADGILELEPVQRTKTGRRLLSVSRTCLKRVAHLAFAHRLTGEERYAQRARQEMLAAAGFSDWNPDHFLDVAEMTAALAIGYDWLHDALSPDDLRVIREAIVEKGLQPSLKGGSWVESDNNWNQVCHGGLTMGALVVAEDHPELAERIIERAVRHVPRAMAEYAPDGAYPEGPGYWAYGTVFNVLLIDALESVLGNSFGLADHPGFLESADYYLHATGPTGLYFNYSDCGSSGGVSPEMFWFSSRRGDPGLLWHEKQILGEFLSRRPRPDGNDERLFPFLLLWAGSLEDTSFPESRHWRGDGTTPVAMHRSSWESDAATYVGIKGGSPSANHGHMDIGSFVVDALGVRWAEDLGAQSYHDLESKGIRLWDKSQDGPRWDVFRLNNFSHNTLVVNGQKQRVQGSAPIVAFSDRGPMPHTIVDLAPVYRGQLAAARRGVGLLDDGSVLCQDEITAPEGETEVRWGMVTRAEVSLEAPNRAVLRRGDRRLSLSLLSPAGAKLQIFETGAPPAEHDAPNRGTRMIGFRVKMAASEEATLAVLLRPGGEHPDGIELRELADW